NIDLFEHYQIDAMIQKALAKKVWLKCGGYLIIERTEALTVIDVNTGKYVGVNNLEDTVLKTNLEAAREIAKQIRVRDVGGIIIIDFIDMHEPEHQRQVIEILKQVLKKDRTKTTVVGMTGLGLIEMTRKKVREGLESVVLYNCPYCEGSGRILSPESVARDVEKRIIKYLTMTIANAILVEVYPTVAEVLQDEANDNLARIQNSFNKKVVIKPSLEVKHDEIKIKEIDIDSLV
ncbi:MAG: ribonuclease E/G, partial [Clostridiaceae bacterium]|nr:ribonuclease E/G [Clostridiaceae bacterium]